jgi:serpin B
MKKIIYALTVFTLSLQMNFIYADDRRAVPEEAEKAVQSSNEFALQLYENLPQGNLCFSPFSISSAFVMAYNGAKAQTEKELAAVFHFPTSTEGLDKGWMWIDKFITFYPSDSAEDVRVKAANSIWLQTNFNVLPTYRDLMAKYFTGAFRLVDFKDQSDAAISTINAWVKENTNGKIIDIVNKQSVDSSTRMVLISALYFKAKWLLPFDTHLTRQLPFFVDQGSIETVASMTQSSRFPYLDTEEAALLEMPYSITREEGPEFAMVIALPHQRDGLSSFEKQLTATNIREWMQGFRYTKATVTMPKFKMTQMADLKKTLGNMGLVEAFSNQADFSGMTGRKDLKISNVLHKVFLAVDETGSEAAAATAITMGLTSSLNPPEPPIVFQVDHPFVYFIIEKKTGIILFIGRVTNPGDAEFN